MRLSPALISGMNFCAITERVPSWLSISTIEPRFMPSGFTRNTPIPPIPSSGFRITSPCSAWNARSRFASRVTSVGATNCGNSPIASFSEWSRIDCALLNTRAPARSASSSSHVDVTYSMSNGGSLRISTAPNDSRRRASTGPASNQVSRCRSSSSPTNVMRRTSASTAEPVHARWRGSHAYTACPRRAASAIIA